jgi:3-methyladenine DNA glycosylase/8-oxoguanine DNA glycosylase
MFHLNRPVGDLGVREAFKRLYILDKRPDAARLEEIAEP